MLPKANITIDEIETVINYSLYNIGEWAELYTTDKNVMKRFDKFAKAHPDYCRLVKEDNYSMTFSVHPKCANLYPKAPKKMNYTDEQKAQLTERLRLMREKQNGTLPQE